MAESGMTDLQFKDMLRRDRADWERVLALLPDTGASEARDEIERVLKRINASLQN